MTLRIRFGLALLILLTTFGRALASDWAPAWTASPQPVWGRDFIFPTNLPASLADRTVRQVVQLGVGGSRVRVRLSNDYGDAPVNIERVHVAIATGGGSIDPATDIGLAFAGRPGAALPAGASRLSDPVTFRVKAGQTVAVSLYFRDEVRPKTFHWDGKQTAYVARGDVGRVSRLDVVETTPVRLYLSQVDVDAPQVRGSVAVLGDSITDGAASTLDKDARWPDFLARRAAPEGIAVVNAGISGARLLSDGMGSGAMKRLDRDVLAQPKVRTMILALGINDIAWPGTPFAPEEAPMTFERMVAGYQEVVQRAHARNVRVIGATLMPFQGALPGTPHSATYYSSAKDALRQRVNEWIRTSGAFDGVVDFDRLLQDPGDPLILRPAYDSGDHLHPGDVGDEAMAQAVDLKTLLPRR